MKTLLEQAEEARIAGDRDKFLKLKTKAEQEKQKEVLARHNADLERVSKEFPAGSYIPELNTTVTEIKNGCGPYKTYSEAVVQHLHHLKQGPEIYGNRGYASFMD